MEPGSGLRRQPWRKRVFQSSLQALIGGVRWLAPWISPEPSKLGPPRVLIAFLVVFAAGMLVVTFVGEQGLVSYWSLTSERDRLTQELEGLADKHTQLLREVHALRTDPEYIEVLARSRLGLLKANEVLVQLPAKARDGSEYP